MGAQMAQRVLQWGKGLARYRAPLLVVLVGVLLLVSGRTGDKNGRETDQIPKDTSSFSLSAFEQQLERSLSVLDGVGRVSLLLSLEETEQSVYAVNIRQSGSGESTAQYERDLTVVNDSGYGQTPVTVKRVLPRFRGAVVLCDGADNAAVRLAVTEAVSTACGLGADKVAVLKMGADT